MHVSLSLPVPSRIRVDERAYSDLVSLLDSDLPEWPGVAGAAVGSYRDGLPETRQLPGMGPRLETGAKDVGPATGSTLAPAAGSDRRSVEPGAQPDSRQMGGQLLLVYLPERMGDRCGLPGRGAAAEVVPAHGAPFHDRAELHGRDEI